MNTELGVEAALVGSAALLSAHVHQIHARVGVALLFAGGGFSFPYFW